MSVPLFLLVPYVRSRPSPDAQVEAQIGGGAAAVLRGKDRPRDRLLAFRRMGERVEKSLDAIQGCDPRRPIRSVGVNIQPLSTDFRSKVPGSKARQGVIAEFFNNLGELYGELDRVRSPWSCPAFHVLSGNAITHPGEVLSIRSHILTLELLAQVV